MGLPEGSKTGKKAGVIVERPLESRLLSPAFILEAVRSHLSFKAGK